MISYSISLSQDRLLNEQFCDMYLDIESKVNPFLINYNKFKMDSKSNINNETAQVFFFIMDEFLYTLAMEKLFLIMMKNLDVINKKIGIFDCMKNIYLL